MVKPQPALKKRVLSPLQQSKHNFSFGQVGEAQAARFLTSKDFTIVDVNVFYKHHEVDLIAFDTTLQELVFVEVKTRRHSSKGHASIAVTKKKVESMHIVAKQYLKKHSWDFDYRFDIITVTDNHIEHFENITWNL